MAAFTHINEQLLVNRVIFAAAGAGSTKLDTFSSWLTLGYAAAIGLLLDKGDRYLPGAALHRLIELFVVVAVLGILAKYVYVLVSGAGAGSVIGRELTRDLVGELDPRALTEYMLKGLPQPARFFVGSSLKKALAGSLLGAPRFFFCLAQLQGALTVLQAACLILAVYTVSHNATFAGLLSRSNLFGF